MVPLAPPLAERRRAERVPPGAMGWRPEALLRPGLPVVLVNISAAGALVESTGRLRPGAPTELQLSCAGRRRMVRGRLARCEVVALDPVRYQGAIAFDGPLDASEPQVPGRCDGEQEASGLGGRRVSNGRLLPTA